MKVRKHIYFSGMVQGVGFRYRAYYLAENLGLTGWVRNLWDDRVEMEVQGEEQDIYKIIDELQKGRFIHITRQETEEKPIDDSERSFRIVGY